MLINERIIVVVVAVRVIKARLISRRKNTVFRDDRAEKRRSQGEQARLRLREMRFGSVQT